MIDEKELVAKKSWHVSKKVSNWIRRGFEEHRPQSRNYLGASALGAPCSRRIVYRQPANDSTRLKSGIRWKDWLRPG